MRRKGFSLVELLVVITIILVLMAVSGAALSNARSGQKKQATQALIGKLDAVIQQQFANYAGRDVTFPPSLPPGMTGGSYRSWFIRRNMINGDLPDRWVDVKYMADNPGQFTSPHQRAYIAVWNSLTSEQRTIPGTDPKLHVSVAYAGAECLFMIVMRGGIANCLDCGDLAAGKIGDKDGDGAFEFWDEWGNPIAFLLWPSAVELPAGGGVKFFSGPRALQTAFPTTGPAPQPTLGMRPLIYSAGPDGEYGFETQRELENLKVGTNPEGRDCGNWAVAPASLSGGLATGADTRNDNLTNFDAEAKQ
jgi:prepilin-type N-terminal cleavage/methylation domain-containing protein